jgi:adenylate cyclase class IV
MQNVEFKAELRDPDLAAAVCRSLGATHVATLNQTDTYYRVTEGRLKKRECPGEPPEWIFYAREDRPHPKLSKFTIYSDHEARTRFGERHMPVWLVVKKQRQLYMLGGVRIHLDSVEGLGTFIEFEALVSRNQNVAQRHHDVEKLRQAFGPALGEPIACGYSDLMASEAA